ncbi:MAG: conserved hypothetical rane protein [Candidatus Solibacter sp.]|nr:conserved hypothetical rane protein [Candidatus Solibacter sp.]
MADAPHAHTLQRKYLEITQDLIVFGLCLMLFAGMGIKLFHLARSMLAGTDFSLVIGDILFLLVLLELFRLLLIYLEEHRVSVSTMVEVGIVSTLREVILRGALHIEWPQLLVICFFILTLATVLRHSGIRLEYEGSIPDKRHLTPSTERRLGSPLSAAGSRTAGDGLK